MERFGKTVVKSRIPILILSILLLIPAAFGYLNTRVNYDVLTYLPDEIETMKGQEILLDEFGTGAISMVVVDGMDFKDVAALKERIEDVDHVKKVIWYDTFLPLSVPAEVLPKELRDAFINGEATLMAVTYDTGTSDDETMQAITDIRALATKQCYVAGISGIVTDTRDLCNREEPVYVLVAVALAFLVLSITMDTFLAPVFFLLSIGMCIVYNLGTNIFFGEISYITKALSAVLQLGVTMDYSIFLWHSYKENYLKTPDDREGAMARAISMTLQSVVGSSITTIAGFIALCFMSFTLGLDIGIVMSKGVLFGVIGCVTILPALILTFDKAIRRTAHKPLLPEIRRLPEFIAKHYKAVLLLFALIWIPAIWGYTHTSVYYQLDKSLPENLPSVQANEKLSESFDMGATHILLIDRTTPEADISNMVRDMEKVDGVKNILGIDALIGGSVPRELLPEEITDAVLSEDYEITRDLIRITDHDFMVVNWASIGMIFLIIFFVFRSISLPALLVLVIEFAIFINMGIPGFTKTTLPFVASIVIGTVQLGSTVDYAILMTSRYQSERRAGKDKREAVMTAHQMSTTSVIVSAFSFFAATIGVGLYSNISMISSLCILMARGALISMVTVLTVLPAVLLAADPVIVRTSRGFLPEKETRKHTIRHETQPQG